MIDTTYAPDLVEEAVLLAERTMPRETIRGTGWAEHGNDM
jgi:hypothetical protein